ncbi:MULTISPECIES: hypothetical protein [Bacillus]|uniref:hypothetical protein n=1 Tax=Bacillus TaxID=1386 RepID=UPI0022433043|nr:MULTISPECIES: hypothetical protein [Bacillus]MDN5388455.1 hypothetical protein [Bacillus sp. LB7]MEC1023183.1 hypothetical protein [Bacillus paralicheniformis]MEC1025749.1 hypothetical protein [Bacillus paralicheniformis]MEC1035835.1 hypothetical protein [Bacillus paralicheniformis]MEC1050027.1 hypothetical protein [Bacillus paralicheniformis]
MVEIKLMKYCPFKDAHYVWNLGFSDYANVQMSLKQFAFKLGFDELSPEYSFIAYDNGAPVGILMNGIKVLGEKSGRGMEEQTLYLLIVGKVFQEC